jgi:hypothetical protein
MLEKRLPDPTVCPCFGRRSKSVLGAQADLVGHT